MKELIPVEYQNQRVLTTQLLAESYETETIKIQQNFLNNESRYKAGKHYFLLEGEELREFKRDLENFEVAANVNKLYLWTEYGALLHAKSLNTDVAWKVYEGLVDNYFRTRELAHQIPQTYSAALRLAAEQAEMIEAKDRTIAELTPKAEFFDQVTDSTDAIDIGSAAKVLNMGIGRNKLFEFLRDKGVLMSDNIPYQRYIDSGYFRTIQQKYTKPDGSTHINIKTVIYQRGLDYIRRLYIKEAGMFSAPSITEAN